MGKVRATSALSSTEDEAVRARQQAEALRMQLTAERRAAEELRAGHDTLQLEVDRLGGQLALQQQEAELLRQQLAAARGELAASEAAASGAEQKLSGLGALSQRLEEMGEQARRAQAATAEAEAEAVRLRAAVSEAKEGQARAERGLREARREVEGAREAEALVRAQLREVEAQAEGTSKALKAAEVRCPLPLILMSLFQPMIGLAFAHVPVLPPKPCRSLPTSHLPARPTVTAR